MPRIRHADALDPVHLHAASLAVKHPSPELALQVCLDLQQLQADQLCLERHRVICGQTSLHRLVDHLVGVGCLLGDGVDSPFEDVAFSTSHGRLNRLRLFVEEGIHDPRPKRQQSGSGIEVAAFRRRHRAIGEGSDNEGAQELMVCTDDLFPC